MFKTLSYKDYRTYTQKKEYNKEPGNNPRLLYCPSQFYTRSSILQPNTWAIFLSVSAPGSCNPLSYLLMSFCLQPTASANCTCVNPAASRAAFNFSPMSFSSRVSGRCYPALGGLAQRVLDKLNSGLYRTECVELFPGAALSDVDVVGSACAFHSVNFVTVDNLYCFVNTAHVSFPFFLSVSQAPKGVKRGLDYILFLIYNNICFIGFALRGFLRGAFLFICSNCKF